MLSGIIICIAAFMLSLLLANLVRKHAAKIGLIDTPNQRSSHTNPTPRGGGLAFVVSFLLGVAVLHEFGYLSSHLAD